MIFSSEAKVAFINARGGTGKTFLMETILHSVRCYGGEKCIGLATASSGIAATVLPLGRTFHSRFKVPVVDVITEDLTFCLKPRTADAKVIFYRTIFVCYILFCCKFEKLMLSIFFNNSFCSSSVEP